MVNGQPRPDYDAHLDRIPAQFDDLGFNGWRRSPYEEWTDVRWVITDKRLRQGIDPNDPSLLAPAKPDPAAAEPKEEDGEADKPEKQPQPEQKPAKKKKTGPAVSPDETVEEFLERVNAAPRSSGRWETTFSNVMGDEEWAPSTSSVQGHGVLLRTYAAELTDPLHITGRIGHVPHVDYEEDNVRSVIEGRSGRAGAGG